MNAAVELVVRTATERGVTPEQAMNALLAEDSVEFVFMRRTDREIDPECLVFRKVEK